MGCSMQTNRLLVVSLSVAFAALAGTAFAQENWQQYVDQVRVKKALKDSMSPEQYQAHVEKMAKFLANKAANPVVRTPADTCGAATYEISALPFGPAASTTIGATDDYDLPANVTQPTCFASTTCAGAPSGTGNIYTGTGTGPDFAFRIRTSANCSLTINMDPTGSEDMALIVYQTQCSSSPNDCACVDDTGVGGVAESVTLNAIAGTDYFLVADGYSSGAAPPGPSGPFTMGVTGSGCTLTPVDLQNFSID